MFLWLRRFVEKANCGKGPGLRRLECYAAQTPTPLRKNLYTRFPAGVAQRCVLVLEQYQNFKRFSLESEEAGLRLIGTKT